MSVINPVESMSVWDKQALSLFIVLFLFYSNGNEL